MIYKMRMFVDCKNEFLQTANCACDLESKSAFENELSIGGPYMRHKLMKLCTLYDVKCT